MNLQTIVLAAEGGAIPVVHPVDGAGQRGEHLGRLVAGRSSVEASQHLHGGGARHVAVRRSTDAVGDHQEVLAGVAGVLVVLAVAAEVGDGGVAQPQRGRLRGGDGGVAHGYFFSSSVVLPIPPGPVKVTSRLSSNS